MCWQLASKAKHGALFFHDNWSGIREGRGLPFFLLCINCTIVLIVGFDGTCCLSSIVIPEVSVNLLKILKLSIYALDG